ncbi:hypothetical protein [Mangrovivirga cuniculi]|uniref:DoxX family protein n=1 Tax=Mangrovivirga cuniculi TaxID=2715131 RepID=A0A4D7JVS9_9BACT|nr:hypothetical protein [Mangrovivirga cuniculi]QCK16632.1 hypothetical protein DCC35_18795 [Mangrovivirga cuniculi]
MRLKKIAGYRINDIIEDSLAWVVVLAMFIYGGAKYWQFSENADILQTPVGDLTGMELMWTFYSYSTTFAVLLGIFEITGGILILFKPTRLIGCFFTSTILVNIIIQDIFFEVNRGALKAAILYQMIILYIFWNNRKNIYEAVSKLLLPANFKLNKNRIIRFSIVFLFFIIFRVMEFYLTTK